MSYLLGDIFEIKEPIGFAPPLIISSSNSSSKPFEGESIIPF